MENIKSDNNILHSSELKIQRRRWISLAIVLVAVFMDLLDSTIVGLAIPVIQRDIGTSLTLMQWVIAAYSISLSILLIVGGRLGDIFGRKRIFILGVAGFILASAICGCAQNAVILIGARAMQGGMAALMIPQVLSIIHILFPPKERGIALGIYGGVVGLATISGPLIGAFLIHGNLFSLGWRTIFLINIPIGIVTLICTIIFIEESKSSKAMRLDIIGMVIVTAGLLLFVYPLIQGGEEGWPIWSFLMIIISIPIFAVFALYEKHIARQTGSPLVVVGLFKQKSFVAGLLVNLCIFSAISAFFFTFGVYWQIGMGFSTVNAGLTSLAWSISVIIISGTSVRLVTKFGRKLIRTGVVLLIAAMAGMIITVLKKGISIGSWNMIPLMVIGGLGIGLIAPVLTNIILGSVRNDDVGSASGIINTVTQMGNGIGVALVGVVFFGVLANQAGISAEKAVPQIRSEFQAIGVPRELEEMIIDDFKISFSKGLFENETQRSISCLQRLEEAKSNNQISKKVEDSILKVMKDESNKNRKLVFNLSFRFALAFISIVFLIAFILITLLPRKSIEM
ncbi:MAG: MFS transporter [Clostridia bacterium]|nr:MFS transporter [Clostridia bacterium]